MDDSSVEILPPDELEQNISGVEIVQGGGPLNDEEWIALLAAQAEDEGAIQYVCPEQTLSHRLVKFDRMINFSNEPIEWVTQGPPGAKLCPILGAKMDFGFLLDNCTEPVSEQYISYVLIKATRVYHDNKGEHTDQHHENLEGAIKLLRNPFTNLPVESMLFVKCI
jgi:hypothetical protein